MFGGLLHCKQYGIQLNLIKFVHRTAYYLDSSKADKKNKILKGGKPELSTHASESENSLQTKTLEYGVVVKDLKLGKGTIAKSGKQICVYYSGYLKENNKLFDSVTKGKGFKFHLGRGEVIKGWDIGVPGMKVGGRRVVTCPPNAAYGYKGSPPTIPANSTLIFEIELNDVN